MAVHTPVPRDALLAFLRPYGLPAPSLFEGIAAGVENTNYRLDAGGRALILTLYEGRTQTADLPYFLALTDHAAARGVPTPAPLTRPDGTVVGALLGRPAALVMRLPGETLDAPTEAQAHAAGRALARLHGALSSFEGRRADPLVHPVGWLALARRLGSTHAHGPEAVAMAERLAASWPRGLPVGPIHADLFPDNVLFAGDALSGIIDPYFASDGPLAYDLAVAMNAWMQEHPSGPDPARAAALRVGYEAVRPLTREERAALPRLRCGAALRFFLTRAEDALARTASDLVKVKDPLPYLALARHQARAAEEG